MAGGKVIASELKVVELDELDENGDPKTSCVIEPAQPGIAARASRAADKPSLSNAMWSLHEAFNEAVDHSGFSHQVRSNGPTVRAVEQVAQ